MKVVQTSLEIKEGMMAEATEALKHHLVSIMPMITDLEEVVKTRKLDINMKAVNAYDLLLVMDYGNLFSSSCDYLTHDCYEIGVIQEILGVLAPYIQDFGEIVFFESWDQIWKYSFVGGEYTVYTHRSEWDVSDPRTIVFYYMA